MLMAMPLCELPFCEREEYMGLTCALLAHLLQVACDEGRSACEALELLALIHRSVDPIQLTR